MGSNPNQGPQTKNPQGQETRDPKSKTGYEFERTQNQRTDSREAEAGKQNQQQARTGAPGNPRGKTPDRDESRERTTEQRDADATRVARDEPKGIDDAVAEGVDQADHEQGDGKNQRPS